MLASHTYSPFCSSAHTCHVLDPAWASDTAALKLSSTALGRKGGAFSLHVSVHTSRLCAAASQEPHAREQLALSDRTTAILSPGLHAHVQLALWQLQLADIPPASVFNAFPIQACSAPLLRSGTHAPGPWTLQASIAACRLPQLAATSPPAPTSPHTPILKQNFEPAHLPQPKPPLPPHPATPAPSLLPQPLAPCPLARCSFCCSRSRVCHSACPPVFFSTSSTTRPYTSLHLLCFA